MDHIGKDVPKAIYVAGIGRMGAENLADSTGLEKNRLQLFSDSLDKDNRYAVVYQSITDGHAHDPEYRLSNPVKKRYWVPLKIRVEGENKARWVLVNKASLHKRFGLSYEEIDRGVNAGNLSGVVEERAQDILKDKGSGTIPAGKFVKAAAEKLTDSEGQVKDRYKFILHDPDNAYAVHYKAVDQPENGASPVLNEVQKRFWVPYRVDNGGGSYTWILLNKSSLRKRLEIGKDELEEHIKKGELPELLAEKARAIDWNFTKSVEEKGKYVEISNAILKVTTSYALKLQEKFIPYYSLKLKTPAKKNEFKKEIKELRQEFAVEWEKVIEPQLKAIGTLESDRFNKIGPVVDESLGKITKKLNKLITGLEINAFPGIKMGKILNDFEQLYGELDAPIQKLEREKYAQLSNEITRSMKSFRGYLQNRFTFFKYEPRLDVTFYVRGINEEFEKLKNAIKGPVSEIQKLNSDRYKKAVYGALGADGAFDRIGLPLADLLGNLQDPNFGSKMDAILKICDDITRELNVANPKV